MSIPCKMRPMGLDSLPIGYTRAEFLDNSGSGAFIRLDNVYYIGEAELDILPIEITADVRSVIFGGRNGYYRQAISIRRDTSDSNYIYRVCPGNMDDYEYTSNTECVLGERVKLKVNYTNRKFSINGESKVLSRKFTIASMSTNVSQRIPYESYPKMRTYRARLAWSGNEVSLIPAIDPKGKPCMFDLVSKQPFYNAATTGSDFVVGMTPGQALNLAHLPVTENGTLTISLPLEAAFDTNVTRALEVASLDKGWHIDVQYRESELIAKNIEADFLESTRQQYIDTGKTLLADTQVKSRFQQTKFLGNAEQVSQWLFGVAKYGAAEHLLFGLWNGIISHPTQSGYMVQGATGGAFQRVADSINIREPLTLEMSRELATLNDEELYYVTTSEFAIGNEVLNYPIFDGIGSAGTLAHRSYLRIWYFTDTTPSGGGLRLSLIPAIDSTGTPCMCDKVSGQNFYNANTEEGAIPFTVGFDTTKKAAISLSKLPVTTAGTLYVALPAEAEVDELVDEACKIAENRGWTIFPQYGTN